MNYKDFTLGDWISHISGVIEDETTLDGNEMRDLVEFLSGLPNIETDRESEDNLDSEPTASRFKCKAEQGSWCKRWERECVSWENCELSSYNFPCPGCVMSSPLEREECDNCCWKDEKQKHYQP